VYIDGEVGADTAHLRHVKLVFLRSHKRPLLDLRESVEGHVHFLELLNELVHLLILTVFVLHQVMQGDLRVLNLMLLLVVALLIVFRFAFSGRSIRRVRKDELSGVFIALVQVSLPRLVEELSFFQSL